MARRFNNPQFRTRRRRVRIEAVLALDAAGIARVVSRDSRCAVKILFAFNASNERDTRNATAAALFVNARKCHPDRAARLLRQLAGRVGKPQRKRRAKAKPVQGVSLRRNGTARTGKQEAKHAAMRARYLAKRAG